MQVLQQPHLKVEIAEGFTNLYGEQRFIFALEVISKVRQNLSEKGLLMSWRITIPSQQCRAVSIPVPENSVNEKSDVTAEKSKPPEKSLAQSCRMRTAY